MTTDTKPATWAHLKAKWFAHADDDGVYLQIELGQGYTVLLTCSGETARVRVVWRGCGSRDFAEGMPTEEYGYTPDGEVVMGHKTRCRRLALAPPRTRAEQQVSFPAA